MNVDKRLFAKVGFDFVLYSRCRVVGFAQSDIAVHAQVHFDSIVFANASSAQMMWLGDTRERENDVLYFLFNIGR